jgi:hypothetical protein
MFNLILLGVFVWGVVEVLTGLRILMYVPLILLAKCFAKPIQIGYTPEVLKRMDREAKRRDKDEHGIPYL